MSSATFPCPSCGAMLRPPEPVPTGRSIRCPACQVVFVTGKQTAPRPSRRMDEDLPPRRPARRRRDDYEDDWDDRPRRRREESKGSNALVWGLVLGGVAFVLAAGGVVALVLLLSSPDKNQNQQAGVGGPAPFKAFVQNRQQQVRKAPDAPARPPVRFPGFGDHANNKPLEAGEREQLLKDLGSTDFFKRKDALDRLAAVPPRPKDPAPVARALEKLVQDENTFISHGAIKALAVWGTKDSVTVLLDLLKISEVFTRQVVIETLGQLKDPRAIGPIAAQLADFACRDKAAEALKAFGPPAEKEVAIYLKSTDLWLKKTACEILKSVGTQQSIPALEAIVNDPSIHVHVHVAPTADEALQAIRARETK